MCPGVPSHSSDFPKHSCKLEAKKVSVVTSEDGRRRLLGRIVRRELTCKRCRRFAVTVVDPALAESVANAERSGVEVHPPARGSLTDADEQDAPEFTFETEELADSTRRLVIRPVPLVGNNRGLEALGAAAGAVRSAAAPPLPAPPPAVNAVVDQEAAALVSWTVPRAVQPAAPPSTHRDAVGGSCGPLSPLPLNTMPPDGLEVHVDEVADWLAEGATWFTEPAVPAAGHTLGSKRPRLSGSQDPLGVEEPDFDYMLAQLPLPDGAGAALGGVSAASLVPEQAVAWAEPPAKRHARSTCLMECDSAEFHSTVSGIAAAVRKVSTQKRFENSFKVVDLCRRAIYLSEVQPATGSEVRCLLSALRLSPVGLRLADVQHAALPPAAVRGPVRARGGRRARD